VASQFAALRVAAGRAPVYQGDGRLLDRPMKTLACASVPRGPRVCLGLLLLAPTMLMAPVGARPLPVDPFRPTAAVPMAGPVVLPPWAQCRGCDLRGADLRGLLLNGMDLRDADLRGADLRGSNLEGADLAGANLQGARLSRAWLSNADLSDTDLRAADLRDAVVIQALTAGTRIEGAVLVGADISGSGLLIGGPEEEVPPLPALDQKPRR
jgi:hypothetical protein